jgi:hypothetical protein
MRINLGGVWDIHFPKYDDHITMTKPCMCFKNLMFGGFYVDIEGIVEVISHTTGSRVEAEFVGKSGNVQSHIIGKCTDQNDQLKYRIEGSWQDEIRLVNV